jgi:hypothetical protein
VVVLAGVWYFLPRIVMTMEPKIEKPVAASIPHAGQEPGRSVTFISRQHFGK